MIVIAAHNSSINLDRLLESMRVHGTDGQRVLIVASGAPPFFEYVEMSVKVEKELKLDWIINPNDSFETGAYIEAYRHFPEDTYLFLQDSMEITGAGWYQQFDLRHQQALQQGMDAVIPWVTFTPYLLGVTPQVRERIVNIYGLMGEPGFGIFGSMFYSSRANLERIEDAGYLNYLPKDKLDSEAFERWWALFFHRLQIPMFAIHADGFGELHRTRGSAWPLMQKHFHGQPGAARG